MLLSQVLFQPGVNHLLTKLDDSKSMFSVAMRDGVDSSGRTLMEYKRNPHGGRERLIEEVLTMLIWGFGINLLKNKVYDPLVRNFSSVKAPDLDMDLLLEGPQKLDTSLVDSFVEKFPGVYDQLQAVVKNPSLQQKYHFSNVNKFLFATTIPVLLIALGIPTFNQWLTKKKQAAEKAGSTPIAQPAGSLQASDLYQPFQSSIHDSNTTSAKALNAFRLPPAQPEASTNTSQFNFSQAGSSFYSASSQATSSRGSQSQTFGIPTGSVPSGSPSQQQPSSIAQAATQATDVSFSGLPMAAAMGASKLLQNERYNTLLIDATLSGGRIYKARNWDERAEIIFREGSIVFFLYFAQAYIQRHISHLIDKLMGTNSHMSFQGTRFLHDRYSKQNSGQFLQDYRSSLQALKTEIPTLGDMMQTGKAFSKEGATLEKPLTDAIRQYALQEGSNNIILETAKASQWIPTLPQAGRKAAQGVSKLDLSKKIDTQAILQLMKAMDAMAGKTASNPALSLEKLLKKSIMGRFSAMILANGVCALFLSYIGPKVQHWMTYQRTGRNDFPGVKA